MDGSPLGSRKAICSLSVCFFVWRCIMQKLQDSKSAADDATFFEMTQTEFHSCLLARIYTCVLAFNPQYQRGFDGSGFREQHTHSITALPNTSSSVWWPLMPFSEGQSKLADMNLGSWAFSSFGKKTSGHISILICPSFSCEPIYSQTRTRYCSRRSCLPTARCPLPVMSRLLQLTKLITPLCFLLHTHLVGLLTVYLPLSGPSPTETN